MTPNVENQAEAVETLPAVQKQPIVVFKGKLIGDTEETVITPALIEEKSKPLLALKINGLFDQAGADAVKEAIQKAVKMRTLVEGQADPLMKKINAQAKKDVQAVKDIAEPIYAACRATQTALQKTWDDWNLSVIKAAQAEADAVKAKTEGREAKMYELGMNWNGSVFSGYHRVIPKTYLFELNDEKYAALLVELEGLQMEAGVTGKGAEPVITSTASPITHVTGPTGYSGSVGTKAGEIPFSGKLPITSWDNAIYDKTLADGTRIVLSRGQLAPDLLTAEVWNDNVAKSQVYISVFK